MCRKTKKIAILLFWILLWQLLAWAVHNSILVAGPAEALLALFAAMTKLSFWKIAGMSLLRIGTGFFLGLAAGCILAAVSFHSTLAEEVLKPPIGLLRTVPVASFVVLFLIWWGSSGLAVAVCFCVVLPQIYTGVLEGLKCADPELLEMARIFRVPGWNRFFYIYRPALRPHLESSLKMALGMCWKSGVAAEIIGTPRLSVGERLYLSKISLDTPGLLAWTAVILLLSAFFEKAVRLLVDAFLRWEPGCLPAGAPERREGVALCCDHVCKSYNGQSVWQDYSNVFAPDELQVLDGPSGSGKTTLLRLLCGLEKPDAGSVSAKLKSAQPADPVRFAVLFQEDRLCEDYSAVRNVELVLGDRARARAALERLLDASQLDKPCRELSGGMRRRVALVRALEAGGDCVLLDEPFAGLDGENRERAASYIRERTAGKTAVLATHIKA